LELEDISSAAADGTSRIGLHNTIFLQGYGPYLISIYIAGEKQNAQEAGATSEELLEDISSSADGTLPPGSDPNRGSASPCKGPPIFH
jgi:hypothetical protein